MMRRAAVLAAVVSSLTVLTGLIGPRGTASPVLVGRVHARFQPNNGKIFVLIIGNDARRGNPDDALADAVHLAGINTRTMRGGILNFPRDLWVDIPGYGEGKINEALFAGGPLRLAQTLEQLTKIRIDYWVMVGFEGFQSIIKKLGGVKMHIPSDVYDVGGSGARLKAGTRKLAGWEALAYMRARKPFRHGDITRTTNHGRLLKALHVKLRDDIQANPGSLMNWLVATQRFARFDMSPSEIFRLGVVTSQVQPEDVRNVTVPVSLGSVNSISVVFGKDRARAIYERFRRAASF